jgi:hypothetical protein
MVANFSEDEAMAHTKGVIGTASRRRPTAPVYVVSIFLQISQIRYALSMCPLAQAFQPNDLKPQATNG